MERRLSIHAGAAQQVIALVGASLLASSPVLAAPKSGEARTQFDRGVAAYTKGDYATAAEALGASYVLEADPETLFAWAQTERKLGRCDRAIDLYGKLLALDLPAENKQAVQTQVDECQAILAERTPAPPPAPALVVEPSPAPAVAPASGPTDARAWWHDPVGGGLVVTGAIGLGLGAVFLVQARGADADKRDAQTYAEYEVLADRAESRGRLGVISLVAGSALVAGGIVWYVTRKPSEPGLTALVLPGGGGVTVSARF